MQRAMRILGLFFLGLWLVQSSPGVPGALGGGKQKIRRSILAGSWYPADRKALRTEIEDYLNRVDLQTPKKPLSLLALISPHAGYRYSGLVAAYGYRLLKERPVPTVVVLAPSHRVPFQGLSLYAEGPYETPLGRVPLDDGMISEIRRAIPTIGYVAEAHASEHSLEIQLPFLQTVLPSFRLVPILMGRPDWETCDSLARVLASLRRKRVFVLIASTDLSHYHSDAEARTLDRRLISYVEALDARGLWNALRSRRCEACGMGPLTTALLFARRFQAPEAAILKYATSGDVTGDRSRVVGYLSAALWSSEKLPTSSRPNPDVTSTGVPAHLSQEERHLLHTIAREAIEARLEHRSPPSLDLSALPPGLRRVRGAFVTLKKNGRLRGCIGNIVGRYPLAETVARMAVAAAFQDPRFPPLRREEWEHISIEISALTPLRRIHDPEEIQVGTHGILIRRAGRSGVLLPQVATEYGWDRKTFLEYTCRKAGLPTSAWKDPDTEIYIFSAEVF